MNQLRHKQDTSIGDRNRGNNEASDAPLWIYSYAWASVESVIVVCLDFTGENAWVGWQPGSKTRVSPRKCRYESYLIKSNDTNQATILIQEW